MIIIKLLASTWSKDRSYKSNRLVTLLVIFAYLVGILVGMHTATANASTDVDAVDKDNTCYVTNTCKPTGETNNPFTLIKENNHV